MNIEPIAKIYTQFPEKFGIPRQSGLVATVGKIVFEPDYRNPDALRGLSDYSHLWLIWGFSLNEQKSWTPTVRPPRLGGNKRVGVFATRSPFRPNPLGLSSVEIQKIAQEEEAGMVIYVLGADLAHGTPIYDIKPYLPYTDAHPEAKGGFAHDKLGYKLRVTLSPEAKDSLPPDKEELLTSLLAEDPRPAYHQDPQRIYKMTVLDMEIEFAVSEGMLTILKAKPLH